MKEEFSEGDLNTRGCYALTPECKVFSSTGDDKSANEKQHDEMW